MLFNLPESDKNEAAEGAEDDLVQVKEVLSFVSPDIDFNNLSTSTVSRLGFRKENATRPRPIKIKLTCTDHKFKLLKASRNLKNYTKHQKIGLSSDKTKKEQLREQSLRAEIDRIRRSDPAADPVVFRGKIMKRSEKESIVEREQTHLKGSGSFRNTQGSADGPNGVAAVPGNGKV